MLAAVADLLNDVGYERMTIGAIAARAGVGRQTVYRWWGSKSAIVGEAVVEGIVTLEPLDRHGEPRTVTQWLTAFAETLGDEANAGVVRALAAAAAEDRRESEALYSALTRPAHTQLTGLIRSGVRPVTRDDAEALADAAMGALLYRLLARKPIDTDYANQLSRLLGH